MVMEERFQLVLQPSRSAANANVIEEGDAARCSE
jgi:hypothetical protein